MQDNTKAIFAEKVQNAGMRLIKVASEILQSNIDEFDVNTVTINLDDLEVSFGTKVKV